MNTPKKYLALGDSMSIDDYTGVPGGGAVNQFHRWLGEGWTLEDLTVDGCVMSGVPRSGQGDLITLTIGGNDLLWNTEQYLREGLGEFAAEHLSLLQSLRAANPESLLIVGDIYAPDAPLSELESAALGQANAMIRANCQAVGATLAEIHATFRGREPDYLCLAIEPTHAGATAIANLFREVYPR